MSGLRNYEASYLLPFASDHEAVRDKVASKYFRHRAIIVASTERQVVEEVQRRGGIPLDLKVIRPGLSFLNPVSRDQKQQYLRAIYTNVKGGMSASVALRHVVDGETGPLRQRLNLAYSLLDSGGSFLEAMQALGFFDRTTLAIMEAGERTGKMAEAINTAVQYYKARASTLKVILTTATWTAVEVIFSILSLIGNRSTVLPMIEKQMEEMQSGDKTQAVKDGLNLAYAVNDTMLFVSLVGIAAVMGCVAVYVSGNEHFKKKIDDIVLKIPHVSDLMLHSGLANSARVAVSLIRGGVPLKPALAITEKASWIPRIVDFWRGAGRRLDDGDSLSIAMVNAPLDPSETTIIKAVHSREDLAEALETVVERRSDFAERAAKRIQVISLIGTMAYAAVAVMIALFVAIVQNKGMMTSLTSS
ncbi:type II secretion system F family protein [Noviherbaspirillum sp. CPCC 100848]|uniref:Type II secretion system F family protein n=1 Tax=Noviherbaspirillum album TaxID=3080276 RepID=A0ABU6J9W0_9BURK|nr:type II secretion system F family protein [Noviherbaspirillum sp. CPCC 100848]MEC4720401.1 type II secretion system F family protein [Noviherbaspirillum sp. CPCC 100848]